MHFYIKSSYTFFFIEVWPQAQLDLLVHDFVLLDVGLRWAVAGAEGARLVEAQSQRLKVFLHLVGFQTPAHAFVLELGLELSCVECGWWLFENLNLVVEWKGNGGSVLTLEQPVAHLECKGWFRRQ